MSNFASIQKLNPVALSNKSKINAPRAQKLVTKCFTSSKISSASSASFTKKLKSGSRFDFRCQATEDENASKSEAEEEVEASTYERDIEDLEQGKDEAVSTYESWEEFEYEPMSAAELKMALLDAFVGTDRGFSASSEVRAEINELLTQLEAKNPTESPTDELSMLGGMWKLAYTSNSELMFLLAANQLPLVNIGDISQNIYPIDGTVVNSVEFATPIAKRLISSTAKFDVRSPKRVEIEFTKNKIGKPALIEEAKLPESVELGGTSFDISPLQGIADQLKEAIRPLVNAFPDLEFDTPQGGPVGKSWLLTTYLDEDVRIARGDGGSIFVLTKGVEI